MSKTNDVAKQKEKLRKKFALYRDALNETNYHAKSAAICKRASTLPTLRRAQVIHIYWPQKARREVDTRPLIHRLREAGKELVMPRVTSFSSDAPPRMEHVRFTGEEALRTNRWGLREPSSSDLVAPSELDAVVAPAFGAGRNGHRIGHGRGFYDRFLAPLDVFSAGLVYASCLVDEAPSASHDVALDVLITETETHRPSL